MSTNVATQRAEKIAEILETANGQLADVYRAIKEASELAEDDRNGNDAKLKDLVGLLSIARRETAQELCTWNRYAHARRSESR